MKTNTTNRFRKSRTRAVVGTILGVGITAAGVAFALWTADVQFAGGTISAGDLSIESEGETTYWDVSPDRKDATQPITSNPDAPKGHGIDLDEWRIVPGDKIAIVRQARIALDGDNLTAVLALSGLDTSGELPMSLSYDVFDTVWGTSYASGNITPGTDGKANLTYFTAGPIGTDFDKGGAKADHNALVHMLQGPDGGAGGGEVFVDVVIYVEFADATGRQYVHAYQSLADLRLELNEVRDTGAQFN